MRCPNCDEDKNTLVQLHWSKRYRQFICGSCKLELSFCDVSGKSREETVNLAFKHLMHHMVEEEKVRIKEKVDNMTEQEMRDRLKELTPTYH